MKILFALLIVVAMTSNSRATVDLDSDSMGIYFDATANCCDLVGVGPITLPVYLVLANPTAVTEGFECTVTMRGSPFTILATDLGAGALDVDSSAAGFAVGMPAPYNANGGAIVLCTVGRQLQ